MRTRGALASCNPTCDDAGVTTPEYDPVIQAAALAEIDALAAELEAAQDVVNTKRDALHRAIERHLGARNAPPGKIATHAKYDRNHVNRIRDAAGIPPLREPKTETPTRRPRKKAS